MVSSWFTRARTRKSSAATTDKLILAELRSLREELKGLRLLRKEVESLRSAGMTVAEPKACPICMARFPTFAPFKNRPHARCPQCGSFERHRLSWLYLKRQTDLLRAPTRFLHFAPEESMRKRIEPNFNVKYTPASYDPEKPAEGIDIQRLPFPDASFDLTYCCHVLEHIPDDRLAMRELARVLCPGGRALILIPTRNKAATYEDPTITEPEERAKHFGRFDHLRWYGRDVVGRLEQAGFVVRVVYFHETLSIDELNRYGVVPEPIFDCTRT